MNAHDRLTGRATESPDHFDARLDLACLHLPTQLPGQPAHQHPRLHNRVYAMLDPDLTGAVDQAAVLDAIERLRQHASPVFETSPVDVRGNSPASPVAAL